MTDINEIIGIIKSLGGAASLDSIVMSYAKKHHMIMFSECSAIINNTLKSNSELVTFDDTKRAWILKSIIIPTGYENKIDSEIEGSPKWFLNKSNQPENVDLFENIQLLREKFINHFSPEELSKMDGKQLLNEVFNSESGMLYQLTLDPSYRTFGAGSKFPYLWPIRYFKSSNECCIYEKNKATEFPAEEGIEKAVESRNNILKCVEEIVSINTFDSISDYEILSRKISKIPFSKFPWELKYYQMIFPKFFPGMYSDNTLNRAIELLGLKRHGNDRIVNMGEISLYTRQCGIDNIVFMHIYGDTWGWDGNPGPCEYARIK